MASRRWWALAAVLVAVIAVVAVAASRGGGGGTAAAGPSPSAAAQQAPALASADTAANGQPVDGIQCQTDEQVLYHIHAHLAVYVNGAARTIPEGIGIPPPRQVEQTPDGPFVVGGKCYYWLHSHTADGIIHIESPTQRIYTLGNWFDIWQQPLSSTQVGPATGTVIAYVNGQRYTGDVRTIALNVHTVIQLDVGTDVAPKPYIFPAGL
ncbi:MAG TPA: hypothetical protein VF112_09860 [Candidatus Dormibacteraeota bacterium]